MFKNSSLRVTQGHATRKLGEASQGSFCAAAESILKGVFKVGPSREGGAGPTWDPALAKDLAPAFFGMVAHHCSLAKFETAMAPMMKYISPGTLLVSMCVPRALVFPSEESGRTEGAMMTSDFQTAAVSHRGRCQAGMLLLRHLHVHCGPQEHALRSREALAIINPYLKPPSLSIVSCVEADLQVPKSGVRRYPQAFKEFVWP